MSVSSHALLLLLVLVGLLLFFVPKDGRLKEVGKVVLFCALFWTCSLLAGGRFP